MMFIGEVRVLKREEGVIFPLLIIFIHYLWNFQQYEKTQELTSYKNISEKDAVSRFIGFIEK